MVTPSKSNEIIYVVSQDLNIRTVARNVFNPQTLGGYHVVPVNSITALRNDLSHKRRKAHILLDLKCIPQDADDAYLEGIIKLLKQRINVRSLIVIGSLGGKNHLNIGADGHIDAVQRTPEHLGVKLRSSLEDTIKWGETVGSSCGSPCVSTIFHPDKKRELITQDTDNEYFLRNIYLVTLQLEDGRKIDAVLKTTSADEARIYDMLKPLQRKRLPEIYGELRSRGWLCMELIGSKDFSEVSRNHLEARLRRIKDVSPITKNLALLMADFFYGSMAQFSALCQRTGVTSEIKGRVEDYWPNLGQHIKQHGIKHYDGENLNVRVMDDEYMAKRFVEDGTTILKYICKGDIESKRKELERLVKSASSCDLFKWVNSCVGLVHLDATLLNILYEGSSGSPKKRLIDFDRGIGLGSIMYCATPLCFPQFVLISQVPSYHFGRVDRFVNQKLFFDTLCSTLLTKIMEERASIPQFNLVSSENLQRSMPYFGISQLFKLLSYLTFEGDTKFLPNSGHSFETYLTGGVKSVQAFSSDARHNGTDAPSLAVLDFIHEEIIAPFYNPHSQSCKPKGEDSDL